jgi:hypothetical protein
MIDQEHRMLVHPRFMALALRFALIACGATAMGDDQSLVVQTKAGATYRGELVERVPGDHITLKLATGEIKRFSWNEIEVPAPVPTSAVPAKTPVAPAASATTAPVTPAQATATGTVHIKAPEALYLERYDGSSTAEVRLITVDVSHWQVVCQSPCDRPVAPGQYRLTSTTARPSDPFYLGAAGTHIDADLSNAAAYSWGTNLMLFSVVPLLVGSSTLLLDYSSSSAATNGQDYHPLRTVGIAGLSIGSVMLLTGTVLWLANWNDVQVTPLSQRSTAKGSGISLSASGLTF